MTGLITSIQRMSIHDGGGIRSTLFLKGCNMRCAWCHNPETWSRCEQLQYMSGRCITCGSCVDVCLSGALMIQGDMVAIDRSRCTMCGECATMCPSKAMVVVGQSVTSHEAVEMLVRDRPFYDESGGGVTLSGGEPLMQADFAAAVLCECKNRGIHTAIETNLACSWGQVERVLPYVDLWMCDLKLADDVLHRKWTGLSNELIIQNLHRLGAYGTPIVVRTPIIPGVNDNAGQVESICRVVKGVEAMVSLELLGFHTLGFDKFTFLDIENPLSGVVSLSNSRLEELKDIARATGVNVK